MDPEHDLAVVTHWASGRSEVVNRLLAALVGLSDQAQQHPRTCGE
jgi:hypothetical protein